MFAGLATGHTEKGTNYGQDGVSAYAESNHGPDGTLFLDPYFKHDLENVRSVKILDAGCGAAPWAIYAAKNGGDVYAIDIQEDMIRAARKAIQVANVEDKVTLVQGDVAKLPYTSEFFDKCISICVACNLPQDSFENHIRECNRTLKNNGVAIIGAPTSLDVVFTNGSSTDEEVATHIQEVLDQLPNDPSSTLIFAKLIELKEILSATFFIKDHRLNLVTNERELPEGSDIWRKLPKLVVPNRFYSKDFYIAIFKKYGLAVQSVALPHFSHETDRAVHNSRVPPEAQLSHEYVAHPPFVVFHVKKSNE